MNGKLNRSVKLPYGLTAEEILKAMIVTTDIIDKHNRVSSLVETFGKNALSAAVSNQMEINLPAASKNLIRNPDTRSHPDILVIGKHKNKLREKDGIEVKTTGIPTDRLFIVSHNVEHGWFIVFQYIAVPFYFRNVFVAELTEDDWREKKVKKGSRATPMWSINAKGLTKLRAGQVYTAT